MKLIKIKVNKKDKESELYKSIAKDYDMNNEIDRKAVNSAYSILKYMRENYKELYNDEETN